MARPASAELSPRELQVLSLISHGTSNAGIGRNLGLTEDTIKTHARRLFRKLRAADRAHAVRRGFETGLLTESGTAPILAPAVAVALDWQDTERAAIARNRGERPMSVTHIGACIAAQQCPCRTDSAWSDGDA